jgi:hypothetical protein
LDQNNGNKQILVKFECKKFNINYMANKPRKTRGDMTIGNLEKKLGLEPGSIRNPDGSDARSDKKLQTLREDFERSKNRGRRNRR